MGFERWRPASREALLGHLITGDRSAALTSLSALSVVAQTPTPTSPAAPSSTTSSKHQPRPKFRHLFRGRRRMHTVHHKPPRLCSCVATTTSVDHLPDDAESLKRLLVAARAAQAAAEAEAVHALAQVSSAEAMIAHYKLAIEKLRRAIYGQRSERGEVCLRRRPRKAPKVAPRLTLGRSCRRAMASLSNWTPPAMSAWASALPPGEADRLVGVADRSPAIGARGAPPGRLVSNSWNPRGRT